MNYNTKISKNGIINLYSIFIMLQAFSLNASGNDSNIPDNVDLADENLPLLGEGIRHEFFLDIYHVGLYSDANSIKEIQNNEILLPVVVRIKFLTDALPDAPPSYWLTLFNESFTPSQSELFTDKYSELKNGDVLAIKYIPDKGTHIFMRGKCLLILKNNDLITKIINGFIGLNPVSYDLKESILES